VNHPAGRADVVVPHRSVPLLDLTGQSVQGVVVALLD
jgi:hypothetical protein